MTFYTLINRNGDVETGLNLIDCSTAILHHDGCDFEVRQTGPGKEWRLWTRQQVAGRGWTACDMWSSKTYEVDAERDILERFAANIRSHDGFNIMTDADYAKMHVGYELACPKGWNCVEAD